MESLLKVNYHDRTCPKDTLIISQKLRELGYITAVIGKWHLGDEPWSRQRAYDFNYSWEQLISAPNYYTHEVFGGLNINENGVCQDTAVGTYGTDLIRDKACNFITNVSKTDNPFFLYVPFTTPHSPWMCDYGVTDDEKKECMMQSLDDAVGKIYTSIINAGIEENTLIVFGSDNGGIKPVPSNEQSNYPYRGYKGEAWEGALNVPFAFYWKNTISPQVVAIDKPVHIIDLYPTFVELAGGLTEDYIDGVSLLPFGNPITDRFIYATNKIDTLLNLWTQCIAYNEYVFVDPKPLAQTEQIYNLISDISQTTDLFGGGLPIEPLFLSHADSIKQLYRSQYFIEDNVSWTPPRCYGHEHRRDDYYKDEYKPLIFIAN